LSKKQIIAKMAAASEKTGPPVMKMANKGNGSNFEPLWTP